MQTRRLAESRPGQVTEVGVSNSVRLLRASDNSRNIYKPISGEQVGLRPSIPARPGEYAKREVAAYRVDEALGFGLVPPTAFIDGPDGPGSLQEFIPSTPGRRPNEYLESRREQLAVLDYIIHNTDRNANYRTSHFGDVVAIDHGLAFPETPAVVQSEFVHRYRGIPLSEDTASSIRAVDLKQLRAALLDIGSGLIDDNAVGLNRQAVDGVMDRIKELRKFGNIPY